MVLLRFGNSSCPRSMVTVGSEIQRAAGFAYDPGGGGAAVREERAER